MSSFEHFAADYLSMINCIPEEGDGSENAKMLARSRVAFAIVGWRDDFRAQNKGVVPPQYTSDMADNIIYLARRKKAEADKSRPEAA